MFPLLIAAAIAPLNLRAPEHSRRILAGANAPAAVIGVLQRSCRDCHSDATVWPWYSHIAPLSWMIERDVEHGRAAMNLSHWDEYTPERRRDWLHDLPPMIRTKKMPLPKYVLLHRGAKLSDEEIITLSEWAARERKASLCAMRRMS